MFLRPSIDVIERLETRVVKRTVLYSKRLWKGAIKQLLDECGLYPCEGVLESRSLVSTGEKWNFFSWNDRDVTGNHASTFASTIRTVLKGRFDRKLRGLSGKAHGKPNPQGIETSSCQYLCRVTKRRA